MPSELPSELPSDVSSSDVTSGAAVGLDLAEGPVVPPFRALIESDGSESDVRRLFGPADRHLALIRDWPSRVALVVGEAAAHTDLLARLVEVGFAPIVTSLQDAARTADQVAPFSFLILGPDSFADDGGVEQVRAWHRCSPGARLKLALERTEPDALDVVVRAMRAGVTDVLDPYEPVEFEASIRTAMTRAGAARERVLAIGAHPDDVEIGCGGTLLDHRRRGDRISILTLSRGAIGGDQLSRLDEADNTAGRIGAQLIFGDLPDTEIDDGATTIRLIETVVRAVDPTVVYVHSVHDNHQDHRAVSTATRSATRGVRRVFAYQSPSATDQFLPTQFVNIDAVVHQKVDVLRMFHSQDGRTYLDPDMIVAGARYWARHLATNARYAEPFEVVRSVGELRHMVTRPFYEVDAAL